MQWFKSKKSNEWTAIRSTDQSTYIASVQMRANAKPLVRLASSENRSIRSEVDIKGLVKKYQLAQSNVSLLLDTRDYQLVQLEKPKVPDTELNEAVRWQLKDMVNFPVEDATIDTIKIPHSQSTDIQEYVYAVAAPNGLIADLSNRLINSKANLKAIDIRMMAQRNIANLLAQEGQGEAILTFGKNSALLTFTYKGDVFNARRIDIDEDKTSSSFEKISLELQRSLDGFEAKFRNIFIKKLLVAPFDERESFCEHLRESIYTKVETFNLEDIFDFEDASSIQDLGQQASFLHVLGAAMRDEVAA